MMSSGWQTGYPSISTRRDQASSNRSIPSGAPVACPIIILFALKRDRVIERRVTGDVNALSRQLPLRAAQLRVLMRAGARSEADSVASGAIDARAFRQHK